MILLAVDPIAVEIFSMKIEFVTQDWEAREGEVNPDLVLPAVLDTQRQQGAILVASEAEAVGRCGPGAGAHGDGLELGMGARPYGPEDREGARWAEEALRIVDDGEVDFDGALGCEESTKEARVVCSPGEDEDARAFTIEAVDDGGVVPALLGDVGGDAVEVCRGGGVHEHPGGLVEGDEAGTDVEVLHLVIGEVLRGEVLGDDDHIPLVNLACGFGTSWGTEGDATFGDDLLGEGS